MRRLRRLAGARRRVVLDRASKPWRSSAATAWARRRCATRSWASSRRRRATIALRRRATSTGRHPEKIAQAGHLLRAAGPPPVPVAHRRRAPDDAGQGHARQALDARSRVRPVPPPRRAAPQRRRRAVGRRAADARRRPGAAAQRFAGDDGRAVGGARAHDRRHPDRGRAPPRRRGSRRARRRAEPPRRDAHGRSLSS